MQLGVWMQSEKLMYCVSSIEPKLNDFSKSVREVKKEKRKEERID